MSRQLIESIISNNMLEANDMVEAKLAEIRERKLHEMKRMFAAKMHEGVGGLTKAEVEARKKAGYRKASEVLGDPRKEMTPIAGHRFKKVKKKVNEETLDEAGLGDAARKVHSMTDQQKQQFKAAMGGSIGAALKLRKSFAPKSSKEKSRYSDTPGGRNREKFDKWVSENPPGSTTLKVAKGVGSGAGKAVGALGRELGSIGFSNLE